MSGFHWAYRIPLGVVDKLGGVLAWVAAVVAVFCAVELAYPGLFTGGEVTARVHWSVWLFVFYIVCGCAEWEEVNPRLSELLNYHESPKLPPEPRLYRLVSFWCESQTLPSRPGSLAEAEEHRWQEIVASSAAKVEDLTLWKEFYVREGLDRLLDDSNPERRFYTPTQRLALTEAFGNLWKDLEKAKHELQDWQKRLDKAVMMLVLEQEQTLRLSDEQPGVATLAASAS